MILKLMILPYCSDYPMRSGLFSDADKYKLDFVSEKLTLEDKLVLLSTVMFVDYLFFEGEVNASVSHDVSYSIIVPQGKQLVWLTAVFVPPSVGASYVSFTVVVVLVL